MLSLKIFCLSSFSSLVFSFSLWKKEASSFLPHLEVQYSVDQQCYAISGLSTSPRAAQLCCWLTWLWGVRCFYREAHLICCPLLTGSPEIKIDLGCCICENWRIKKNPNGINSWPERSKTVIQSYIYLIHSWSFWMTDCVYVACMSVYIYVHAC